MNVPHIQQLESFGTRSLVTHGIMVITFTGAILLGLFGEGEVALISFVALLNFTAGLWVAHSVHSLGNVQTDDEYSGVLNEVLDLGEDSGDEFDTGRFGRILVLIAGVSTVSLLTSAQALGGAVFSVAVVAIGTIAAMTAMVGFLIAVGAAYDATSEPVDSRERSSKQADAPRMNDR